MAERLAPDVEAWDDADRREFFRLLGLKLQEFDANGQALDLIEAMSAVARDLVEDESEAVRFGDDICNDDLIHDEFYDYDQGWLVFMSWDGDHPGAGGTDGVRVLDFGSGQVFTALPPHEEYRSSWEITAVIDSEDEDALRDIVLDDLASGALPDRLMVSHLSRAEIHQAYTAALDSDLMNHWDDLSAWLENRIQGSEFPIDSPEQRAAALSAYLDHALEA